MNLKQQLFGAALVALFAAGCASHEEPIIFSSQARPPASMMPSAAQLLPKADEQKISQVVFSYLLERKLSADTNCSAIFLQADDLVVAAMMRKFSSHVPPIKPSERIDLRSKQSPLDRDTGKPVLILSVEVAEPNAEGSVGAVGRWYAGGAVMGSFTFSLKKTGEDWPILTVK